MKHYHIATSSRILCAAQILDVLDGVATSYNPLAWRGLRLQGHNTVVPTPDGWLEFHKPVSGAYLVQDQDARTWTVSEAEFLEVYKRASPADDSEYTVWPIRTNCAFTGVSLAPAVPGDGAMEARETTFENLAAEMDASGATGWAARVRELGARSAKHYVEANLSQADLVGLMQELAKGSDCMPLQLLAPARPADVIPGLLVITDLPTQASVEIGNSLLIGCAAPGEDCPRFIAAVTNEWYRDTRPQIGGGLVVVNGSDPTYYPPGSFTPELPKRVTKQALEAMLRSVTYEIRPDGRTTVCEITFHNGFSLRDEASCAHIDSFNEQLGQQYAYERALDRAWAYAGFLLMEDRYRGAAPAVAAPAKPDVDAMVSRFLGWKLPEMFVPDCGISFTPLGHPHSWPVGTNLLTADQAKAMFEYCLKGVQ
jgi:hypothetical protein